MTDEEFMDVPMKVSVQLDPEFWKEMEDETKRLRELNAKRYGEYLAHKKKWDNIWGYVIKFFVVPMVAVVLIAVVTKL